MRGGGAAPPAAPPPHGGARHSPPSAPRSARRFAKRSLLRASQSPRSWCRQGRLVEEGPMDLGIRGRNAIVCASSRGLGKACAMSLAREGVNITMMARTKDVLEAAAKEIRDATGVRVTAVAGDVTTEAGRAALLAACPAPDILVNNAGGPPPGDFREWDRRSEE